MDTQLISTDVTRDAGKQERQNIVLGINDIGRFFCNLTLSNLSLPVILYPGVLLHEIGHFIAMKTLFANIHPYIELDRYGQGRCIGKTDGTLTALGNVLGTNHSHAAVDIAGPAMDFALGVLGIAAGHKMKSHLDLVFLGIGYWNMASLFGLAYSQLFLRNDANGDFFKFSQHAGIAPGWVLVATAALALPALFIAAWKITILSLTLSLQEEQTSIPNVTQKSEFRLRQSPGV